jgi:hypothetical protein
MFRRLAPILLNLSMDTDIVHFACGGCNQISAYSKSDLPAPRTFDNLEQVERFVVIQRVFHRYWMRTCRVNLRSAYETTGEHYDTGWIKSTWRKASHLIQQWRVPTGTLRHILCALLGKLKI